MSDPTEPQTVTLIDPDGNPKDAPAADVPRLLRRGFTVESNQQHVDRVVGQAKDEVYGTPLGKLGAAAAEFNRVATFGGSDVVGTAIDPDMARHYRNLREVNPISTAIGGTAAVLATAIPTGGESAVAQGISKLPGAAVGRLGAGIAEAGEGANVLSRIGHAAAGGAVEGALYGAGSGVSELAMQDEPLTLEHAISTISSHALYGGEIGGAVGSVGKLAELGLSKGKAAVDAHLASTEARTATDDLAGMDVKQLKAARETELEAIKASHKEETTAIEATRAKERSSIADDISELRQDIKEQKHFLTTKDVDLPAAADGKLSAGELGRVASKANKQLDNVLDNPIGLTKNPAKALDALQRQETAMVKLTDRDADLRAIFSKDTTGERLRALDSVPAALEKNRALQERIAKVSEPLPSAPASSPRLEAIEAAKEALAGHGGGHGGLSSIPQHMLEGSVFGAVSSAAHAIPVVGPMASHLLGAAASKFVGEKVFGRLGDAAASAATRTAKAASRFLEPAAQATKAAVPIATKVLASVRFAPTAMTPAQVGAASSARPSASKQAEHEPATTLADHFKARSEEIRSQTAYGPDGTPQMRPEARQELADRLKGVAALSPIIADRLETLAAQRLEFLAARLPRKPDVFGLQLGPDKWQPSDMEMRKFARYVAGVEDPSSIMERLSHGLVSPEDGEVMREVYPQMLGDLQQKIVEGAPSVRKTIPYQRRIALSLLTGMPVDAAMDPQILASLQGSFAAEEGSEGGTQAPVAQPQFGSVSKSIPQPTPAQKRMG